MLGNYFRTACNKAGVHKSAHGVRKISATRAANAGANVAELKALFGWTDDVIRHFIVGVQTAFGLPRRRSQNYKIRTNYKLLCPLSKNN
jgi:Phage integrase family.